jgi:hypothetical protein|tara:strand:+ start:1296 stop:1595 length:300 start_codon:yes stop_codon:yes gene_type:complete
MAITRDLRLNSVPGSTAHKAGVGVIASASSTESIVISDIMANTTGELRKDDASGDVIVTIATAGHSNLVSPIEVSAGSDIYNANSAMNVTINYWKNRMY